EPPGRHPAQWSDLNPVTPATWNSLQGLVSVGPFASTTNPLGPASRPRTTPGINGHYPAFSTTTNHLTPRRASARVSHPVIASPTSHGPTRDRATPGPPATPEVHVVVTTQPTGPCEVSLD